MLGAPARHVPDIFDAENQTLLAARAAHAACPSSAQEACGQALGDLILAYERLLRETRRLVRRSDRAELEMNQMNTRLQDLAAELEHRANHDPLTGVLNRAAVIDLVNRHFGREDLALIVLDIDHFKRLNDTWGHLAGDKVLRRVAAAFRTVVRDQDVLGRLGGEEFLLVLPNTSKDEALQVAERIRAAVAAIELNDIEPGLQLTISLGGTDCQGADEALGQLLRRADEALYSAKEQGRNRVVWQASTPSAA